MPVFGVLRRTDRVGVPSRHLGLVPVAERGSAAVDAVAAMGALVSQGCDLDALVALARSAGALPGSPALGPGESPDQDHPARVSGKPRPRVALAGGAAFTFSYAEHAELLAAAGAEVVVLDPRRDEHLPDGTDGLVIGGGSRRCTPRSCPPTEPCARPSPTRRARSSGGTPSGDGGTGGRCEP
ncbi:Hydrogenobyrinate a,c-diamide synthase OS=Streptomyces fumanus OX=67302 GN=cobB PE=3 SV=1 [Streptomyces fumanus]